MGSSVSLRRQNSKPASGKTPSETAETKSPITARQKAAEPDANHSVATPPARSESVDAAKPPVVANTTTPPAPKKTSIVSPNAAAAESAFSLSANPAGREDSAKSLPATSPVMPPLTPGGFSWGDDVPQAVTGVAKQKPNGPLSFKVTPSLPGNVFVQRIIRVFISSALAETAPERDYFLKNAAKSVINFCEERYFQVVFVDLRIGTVSPKDTLSTLQLSLESIEKCQYYICCVGSSYGIPLAIDSNMVQTAPLAASIQPNAPRSHVEYEVLCAALKDKPMANRALFYFRGDDYTDKGKPTISPKETKFNASLKSIIREHYKVSTYKSIESFSQLVANELVDSISEDLNDTRVTVIPEKDRSADDFSHWYIKNKRVADFRGRENLLKQLKSQVEFQLRKDLSPITVVTGESGIGKTSLMSTLIHTLEAMNDPDMIVFYHIASSSRRAGSVDL